MSDARENLFEECPSCGAPRTEIEESDASGRTAMGRYACGSVYLAFRDPRQGPACVGACLEPRHERSSGESDVESERTSDVRDDDDDYGAIGDIPDDFERELLSTADLETSFDRLRGVGFYYAETLRGRIRSLQLRVDDAWNHFEAAEVLSPLAPDSMPDLARQLNLHVFTVEHALVAGPRETRVEVSRRSVSKPPPDPPPGVDLGAHAEVADVYQRHRLTSALALLYAEEFDLAAKTIEHVIEAGGLDHDALAMHYLGLAACRHNLGDRARASEILASAGLATRAATYTLNRGRVAAALVGIHGVLGNADDADDWRSFLLDLRCPDATKVAFLRRGERLRNTSEALSRLVVF